MGRRIVRSAATFALATLAAVPALGAVQVPASGWTWSSPQPQGNAVFSLASLDATNAIAGGEAGTLIATADGGNTWTGIRTGTLAPIGDLTLHAPGVVTYSTNCDVYRRESATVVRRLPFRPFQGLTCNNPIAAAPFLSPDRGLILLGNGTLFATSDGGRTFARRSPLPIALNGGPATDIAMNAATPGLGLATAGNTIARTTDDGATWTIVHSTTGPYSDVTFADATTAYAVGFGGQMVRSADGGATWSTLATGLSLASPLSAVSCASASLCLAATDAERVLRTTDGGASFATATFSSPIYSVAMLSPTRALAMGLDGAVHVSDDGGATWRQVDRRHRTRVTGIRVNPDGFAYGWGAAGGLVTSADGGSTWAEPGVATGESLRAASFATREVGYALDRSGAAFRTVNGGASWQILDLPAGFVPVDVISTAPDGLVVLGLGGGLIRSIDGGRSFTTSGDARVRAISRHGGRSGSLVVLYGRRNIAMSKNVGATWRIVAGPAGHLMRTAHCPGALTCWAVTSANRVFRTINAGRRWTEVSGSVGRNLIFGAHFTSRNSGYLALTGTFDGTQPDGGAWLLRTSDGGRTWAPQLVSSGRALTLASGGGVDYALDGSGYVFTTTTGGEAAPPSRLTLTTTSRVISGARRVTFTGRLTPAAGGERIVFSTTDRRARAVRADARGVFTTTLLISSTTSVVAQWAGDATRASAGSPSLTVRRR